MIKLSLIQTSQNRLKELIRFVDSLNAQEGIDFSQLQLIFVDQEDNKPAFEKLNTAIKFTYVKTQHCSLSHARNLGLPLTEGKYVCFPDDDCWYEPDTLNKALALLEKNEYQIVSGKGLSEDGVLTSSFPQDNSEMTSTKRCAAISYTMFFLYEKDVFFDENMGVGSPYNLGAGEETDYLLLLMEKMGFRAFYMSSLIVHHPVQTSLYEKKFLLKKFYSYSRGAGYLMRKHRFSFKYKLSQFLRPFCGVFIHLLFFRIYEAKKSYCILKGRMEGALFKVPLKGKE